MIRKLGLIFVTFILLFSLVVAEGEPELGPVDYSQGFEDIQVQGGGLEMESSEGGNKFYFSQENAYLEIGESKFENIVAGDKESNIELDYSGKVTSAEFEVNEKGGSYTINGVDFEAPPNSKITYSDGIVNIETSGQSIKSLPKIEGDDWIKFEGDVTLPDGKIVNGLYMDKDGFFSYQAGTLINGLNYNYHGSGLSRVYFDGQKHEGNYISFGEKNLYISGKARIDFMEDNSYVKIEDSDKFFVNLIKGNMAIESNVDTGKIPSMSISGEYYVRDDSIEIINFDDDLILKMGDGKTTSTPLKMSFENKDGSPLENLIFEGKANEVLFDNFNRFSVVPDSSQDEFYSKNEGMDIKFSSRLNYNYVTKEDMDILTGNRINNKYMDKYYSIPMENLPEGQEQFYYGRIRDYWEILSDDMKMSFSGIYLLPDDEFKKINGNAGAAYNIVDNSIYYRQSEFDLPTFKHEIAHAQHYSLTNKNPYKGDYKLFKNDFKRYIDLKAEEKKQYGLFDSPSPDSDFDSINEKLENIELELESLNFFSKEMMTFPTDKNNDNPLSKEFLEISSDDYQYGAWRFEESTDPFRGFVRPYGSSEVEEDIATYIERANEPEFFKDLINPDSKKYDIRYRQKLDILNEYGLLTDLEYNNILGAAGVK